MPRKNKGRSGDSGNSGDRGDDPVHEMRQEDVGDVRQEVLEASLSTRIDVEMPEDEYGDVPAAVVGGAVRDALLSEVQGMDTVIDDIDLVATETSPDELEQSGMDLIDAESAFPVFHDSLGRELALARREETTGDGYHDFEMDIVSPDTPQDEALDEDLERRDLTINAMAFDPDSNTLYDPYGGVEDIREEKIRHVSDAFSEDPLRVVRAARYKSRFGFDIADETQELMEETAPKMKALPDDRFGKEMMKTFKQADNPRVFFEALDDVDALGYAFPELEELQDVSEGGSNAYEETLDAVERADRNGQGDQAVMLGALGHRLDDADVDASEFRKRLQLEGTYRGMMDTVDKHSETLQNLDTVSPESILPAAEDIVESKLSVEQCVEISDAISGGDIDAETASDRLQTAVDVVDSTGAQEALRSEGYTMDQIGDEVAGEEIGEMISDYRVSEIAERFGKD